MNVYFDTETTGLTHTALPYIVCYAIDDGPIKTVWLSPLGKSTGTRKELLECLLNGVAVGANVWFDVRMLVQCGMLTVEQAKKIDGRDVLLNAFVKRGISEGLKKLAESQLRIPHDSETDLLDCIRAAAGNRRVSKGYCKTHGYLSPDLVERYCRDDVKMTRQLHPLFAGVEKLSAAINEANKLCMLQTLEGLRVDTKATKQAVDAIVKHVSMLNKRIPFNASSPKQIVDALGTRNAQRETLATIKEDDERYGLAQDVGSWKDSLRVLGFLKSLCAEKETGRVHPLISFNAVTGRARCEKPNMQQLPGHLMAGVDIRKIVQADDAESLVVSCDYDQIELRLFAALFEIKELIEKFKNGEDVHTYNTIRLTQFARIKFMELAAKKSERSYTAAQLEQALEQYGDIVSAEEALKIPLTRKLIKRFTFANIYGAGDVKLASVLKAPVQVVRSARHAMEEMANTPAHRALLRDFRRTGKVLTHYGRTVIPRSEHAWVNSLIQGTAADVLHRGLIKLSDALPEGNRVMLTVHDEALVSAKKRMSLYVVKLIEKAMLNTDFVIPLTASGTIHKGGTWGISG